MRVLVVEDNAVTLESLEMLLASDGHEVIGAGNGHAALTRLALHVPDVILLDWRMPGMSGKEFLEEMRKHHDLPETKVIVMSALAKDELTGLPDGVMLLRKPFDPRELSAMLKGEDAKSSKAARGRAYP